MFNYEITKDNTVSKIQKDAKAKMYDLFIQWLETEFGAENVGMMRTVSDAGSATTELGVVIGVATEGDETYPITVAVNPTVKTIKYSKTAKRENFPFNFKEACNCYDAYITEKAEKAEAKKAAHDAAVAKAKAKD